MKNVPNQTDEQTARRPEALRMICRLVGGLCVIISGLVTFTRP